MDLDKLLEAFEAATKFDDACIVTVVRCKVRDGVAYSVAKEVATAYAVSSGIAVLLDGQVPEQAKCCETCCYFVPTKIGQAVGVCISDDENPRYRDDYRPCRDWKREL